MPGGIFGIKPNSFQMVLQILEQKKETWMSLILFVFFPDWGKRCWKMRSPCIYLGTFVFFWQFRVRFCSAHLTCTFLWSQCGKVRVSSLTAALLSPFPLSPSKNTPQGFLGPEAGVAFLSSLPKEIFFGDSNPFNILKRRKKYELILSVMNNLC